jgi:hypothetical protein
LLVACGLFLFSPLVSIHVLYSTLPFSYCTRILEHIQHYIHLATISTKNGSSNAK